MAADPQEADDAEIRARAVKLLARREHAPAELARKLTQRGYPSAAVDRVLDALIDENLLSATRYAESFTRTRIARGFGPLRIRSELDAAGIDARVIDTALMEADVDWCELAADVRHKRFGECIPASFPERAKQMRYLQRRGFRQDDFGALFSD